MADFAIDGTGPPEFAGNSVGIRLACAGRVTPRELRQRATDFAKRVLRLTGPLLERPESSDLARQLRKAATSVSSNYRAAGRARSHKEFTAKIGVVREEADEALHWLVLIRECSLAAGQELEALASEAEELVKIFARSFATASAKEREKAEKTAAPAIPPASKRP